jgi:hypothetical protein
LADKNVKTLRDRLRDVFFRPTPQDQFTRLFVDKEGKPKTVIATGGGGGAAFGGGGGRSQQLMRAYWSYYINDGTIFASVNTTAWNTVMTGYTIVTEEEGKKEEISNFLNQVDFDGVMLDSITYALIFGDAFIEKVRKGKEITSLKIVDPITMEINTDEFGRVESYQQRIRGQLQAPLKPEDIIHIRLFNNPASPYGISLIAPTRATIDRKAATDDAVANAIIRHGTGKFVVTVGDKDFIPDESVFTAIKSKLEDITATNEFIVPGPVTITEIDQKGISGVEEYYNYFQTQLVIGLLCPEEALGLGRGSTEATSKVKEIMYERMIKAFQHKISEQVLRELIYPLLGYEGKTSKEPPKVKFRFNSVTDADEAIKAKWLGNLLKVFRDDERKPFTINEIRAVFDYPPIEGGDELGSAQPTGETEKPTGEEKPPEGEQQKKEKKTKRDVKELYDLIDELRDEINQLRESNE